MENLNVKSKLKVAATKSEGVEGLVRGEGLTSFNVPVDCSRIDRFEFRLVFELQTRFGFKWQGMARLRSRLLTSHCNERYTMQDIQ